jgi:hypothetical protein
VNLPEGGSFQSEWNLFAPVLTNYTKGSEVCGETRDNGRVQTNVPSRGESGGRSEAWPTHKPSQEMGQEIKIRK